MENYKVALAPSPGLSNLKQKQSEYNIHVSAEGTQLVLGCHLGAG